MVLIKRLIGICLMLILASSIALATQEQVRIQINEFVDQTTYVNPLKYVGASYGIWADTTENQSYYNITGFINVSNSNLNGETISDIYISLDYTTNITLPVLVSGRNGTFISNDSSSDLLVLHIPELRAGEYSYWTYSINTSNIRPLLNITTSYSDTKILAGENVTLIDTLENTFDSVTYQTNTCVDNINLTQRLVPVNFSGTLYNFTFITNTTNGSDASNVSYTPNNQTQFWIVRNGSCMNKGDKENISYVVVSPYNIPKTTDYIMMNTSLKYRTNNTISHLRVIDITAISRANVNFEKRIMGPSDPVLYGSNVTWNVTGHFNVDNNITYNLTSVTLWVSKRNVNGSYTDPNTIDQDPINGVNLTTSMSPFVLVNSTLPWTSSTWLFNYSDIPTPIVWMEANFTIQNDGTQLINRSITQNGSDIYIKEIYLIIGYWLEINKNITSIGDNKYHVRIDVHNKGNQVTPADTIVTIYDFVPSNYNVTDGFVFSDSQTTWYYTSEANNSVNGEYNGTLFQWGLVPSNSLNTSFAAGPEKNVNTTWSVDFNVTGKGDYQLMDVFITGLDPQQVDGAGSTRSVIVSEIFDRIKSTEGIFASVASVLLLLGLLL